MKSSIIVIFEKILASYSICLIIFGSFGNIISFCVCLRKNLIKVPTFVFLCFMMMSDMFALYFWNLDHFVTPFFGFLFEGFSVDMCRFFFTSQLIAFQFSAWALVSI
jgi:hypothetical protein